MWLIMILDVSVVLDFVEDFRWDHIFSSLSLGKIPWAKKKTIFFPKKFIEQKNLLEWIFRIRSVELLNVRNQLIIEQRHPDVYSSSWEVVVQKFVVMLVILDERDRNQVELVEVVVPLSGISIEFLQNVISIKDSSRQSNALIIRFLYQFLIVFGHWIVTQIQFVFFFGHSL